MSLGENIRLCRERLGFSQEQLANRCGLHRNSIYNYENGIRNPSTKILSKIASTLGASEYELLESLDIESIGEHIPKPCMTKQEFDDHTKLMISNLIRDQTVHNINRWGVMHNFHEMYALGLEEHEEAQEQLHWLSLHKGDMWDMIKANNQDSDIRHCLGNIIEYIGFAVQELVHEAAVYQRALDTMTNEKAPTADQSK